MNEQLSDTSRGYITTLSTFIIAASILVVLTTLAVNMLASTGNLNQLLIQWSNLNHDADALMMLHNENDSQSNPEIVQQLIQEKNNLSTVIHELTKELPDAEIIFSKYITDGTHPNHMYGLVKVFTLMSHTNEITSIRNNWANIVSLNNEKEEYIQSFMQNQSSESYLDTHRLIISDYNGMINRNIQSMIDANASVLILLKQYSLWFTVLLGILIVIIGVIFSVRGVKYISQLRQLALERDYLSKFPELNEYPVLNITTTGDVGYLNQAAKLAFPDLEKLRLEHPFLANLKRSFIKIISTPNQTYLNQIQINGKYFQQSFHYLSEEMGIHVHSIDITKIKKQQIEISRALKEKTTLLSEVHHRVKNNLATINGMLGLQEMMGSNPNTALKESQNRIKSMSIIHDLLYKSNTFSAIDLMDFIQKIGQHLEQSFSSVSTVKIGRYRNQTININQALPLGLLINEIAFFFFESEYGYHEKTSLKVNIIKTKNRLHLTIHTELTFENNPLNGQDDTLQVTLINNFLKQLHGELILDTDKNVSIEISFPPIKNIRGTGSGIIEH